MAIQDTSKMERPVGQYVVTTRDVGTMVGVDVTRHTGTLDHHTDTFYLADAELDEMITLLVDTLERRKAFKDGRADGWAAARLKELQAMCRRVEQKHAAPIPDALAGTPPGGRHVEHFLPNEQRVYGFVGPAHGEYCDGFEVRR